MNKSFEAIKYTIRHKRAFLKVEKDLCGHNTFRGYAHDVDKIFMYLIFGKRLTSKIHRKMSRHHDKAKSVFDYKEMVLDWECARITKPDKPLNAYETLLCFYPNLEYKIMPILIELGLD